MQVGYIFQCAFELESWTDIAVVLVPSITLKMQLLQLKSSTVRKLNKHLIYLLFQTNRCFHESIFLCGISKGQPTNNLFFHFLQFNSVSEFWNIIEFFKLIQLVFLELIIGHNHLFSIVQKYSQSSQECLVSPESNLFWIFPPKLTIHLFIYPITYIDDAISCLKVLISKHQYLILDSV